MGIGYMVILIGFMALGWIVQLILKRKFKKYAQVPVASGLSGKEVAEKMLRQNGINDVQVISVAGRLTDHYNPANKTINLSDEVYHGRSVSATAVAAHECGHAVQHAKAYSMLKFRSAMVPVTNISSQALNIIFMIGMFFTFGYSLLKFDQVLMVVIGLQGVVTLFTLVTLPVEFDASNRALAWLKSSGTTPIQEQDQAKDALKWAAMTYVVAALAALTTLAYYIMLLMGRRDD
jgi:uncharacterized protein